MDSHKQPGIRIAQIFLNKALFEHGPDAMTLPHNTPLGEHKLKINFQAALSDDETAGVATLTVQTSEEDPGHYRFIVEMVALVAVEPGGENMSVKEYLTTAAGPTIYPFVRETVASLTQRGRFGPIWLKPMNFSNINESVEKSENASPPE